VVGFVIDVFAYAATCGLATGLWLLAGSGTVPQLQKMTQDPTLATQFHFWPAWIYLVWGALIVLHLGIVLGVGLFGGRARRRRLKWAQLAASTVGELNTRTADVRRASAAAGRGRTRTPARHWVTVMFTDVANSTGLNEELGDDRWADVLAHHRTFMRARFVSGGGEVVGTQGDGFLVRFGAPSDAVRCAIDIQRDIDDVGNAGGLPLQVRIGIHAGEALEDQEGDLVGRIVNIAARVTSGAEAGEILVTEPVAEHLDDDIKLEDRGLRELRGLARSYHLFAVAAPR